MGEHAPKQNHDRESDKGTLSFDEMYQKLLPGVEFQESEELKEARAEIVRVLQASDQSPESLQETWIRYADLCEESVDSTPGNQETREKSQIAVIVHKALIFREVNSIDRYVAELSDALTYAHHCYLDEIAKSIYDEIARVSESSSMAADLSKSPPL